jgi:hypothetical protein
MRACPNTAASRDPLVQAMPLQLPVKRAAADSEKTRGYRLVPAHLLQSPNDVLALHGHERRRRIRRLRPRQATR